MADAGGHEAGRRLIDYRSDWCGALLEAGWHWEPGTAEHMGRAARRLVGLLGLGPAAPGPAGPRPRFARVTETVTARTGAFVLARPWRGGEVVREPGALLALDGEREVRTPHADCLLVMPSLVALPGQTALRLARFEAAP